MAQSPTDSSDRSQLPSFSKLLTVFGVLLIIVGALILVGELIRDSRGGFVFEPIRAVAHASIMLCGIVLTAVGQGLAALQSIAISCAGNAEKN